MVKAGGKNCSLMPFFNQLRAKSKCRVPRTYLDLWHNDLKSKEIYPLNTHPTFNQILCNLCRTLSISP